MKCWFCKKGRHNDCMKQIPMPMAKCKTYGMGRDCSFDVEKVICECCGLL